MLLALESDFINRDTGFKNLSSVVKKAYMEEEKRGLVLTKTANLMKNEMGRSNDSLGSMKSDDKINSSLPSAHRINDQFTSD